MYVIIKANLQAQVATLKSRKMSLEQELQLIADSVEAEKSHGTALREELQSKAQSLLLVQQELDGLKEELATMSRKAEESSNHVKILASSCNESKITIAAKEKV